jgi:cytolysin-activating lysine-acyltransferase
MWKKKKAKIAAGDATMRGLASQSETSAVNVSVPTSGGEEVVTSSDETPKSPVPNEAENVVTSSAIPTTPQQQSAIRQVDVSLGQIVSILIRSPQHKQRPLADLEWLVLPAVLSGQFRVAQAQQAGIPMPVGVALWASVSTAVDQRLSDLSIPLRVNPDEWRSGDILWLVELVADTKIQQALLKNLGDTVLKERGIKMRVRDADGKTQIGTFKAAV